MQDIKFAVRSLLRDPTFAVVVILILGLSIGANTAMFSLIHATLLKPLPYKDPERLVMASTTFHGYVNPWTSLPDYYDFREQGASFETVSAVAFGAAKTIVTGGERPVRLATMRVSADLFRTLGATPAAGRWFSADEGKAGAPYVVIVSEGVAQRRFGSAQAAVGRTLSLSGLPMGGAVGSVSATIIGVMPASFRLLDDAELWLPMRRGENDGPLSRQFHNWLLIGRLKAGATIKSAQREADIISQRLRRQYPEFDSNLGFRLDPLQAGLFRGQTPSLMVLMAAVGLVLLIACANVAGLLLARGASRRLDLAVRAALGASRARIARLLLTESLLLAMVSGLAGIVLAMWLHQLLPIATGLANARISIEGLNAAVVLFAMGLTIATGLLFGLAPALRASSARLAEHLGPGVRTTEARAGMRLRGMLVVGQVAVSLALLIAAGLLIRSFGRLAAVDPGFNAQHLLTGEIQLLSARYPDPDRQIRFFEELRNDVAAIPGVTAVGFIDRLPIRNPSGNYPVWAANHPPSHPSEQLLANLRLVLPGYFDTLRIPLAAGRDFTIADRVNSPNAIVVNERMATTFFPGRSPLGQWLMVVRGPAQPLAFEIVGVVGDARIDGIGESAPLTMYTCFNQFPQTTMRFAARTGLDPDALSRTLGSVIAAHDPDIPVERLISMERLIGDSLLSPRVTTITLTLFSSVALLLASIGLYGVLAYYVVQRRHEIGVRMALGADMRVVLKQVLGRSLGMVLPGLAIGLALSFAGARLIRQLLYHVEPSDPVTFIVVSVCLAAAAFLASVLPAWKASRIDPIQALRNE